MNANEPWVIQAISDEVEVVCVGEVSAVFFACEELERLLYQGADLSREQRKKLYAARKRWEAAAESNILSVITRSKTPSEVRAAEYAQMEDYLQRSFENEAVVTEYEKAAKAARFYRPADGEPRRIRAQRYERRAQRNQSKRAAQSVRRIERRLRQRSRECVSCG